MFEDLRYGIRILLKNSQFALVAICSLALAIGINGAVFSVLSSVLLRALPYSEPDRLMTIHETRPQQDATARSRVSYPNFESWRLLNQAFEDLAAVGPRRLHFADAAETETFQGEIVSASYFSVLGVDALSGRTFLAEEDATPGTHPVCLLGYHLWQRRFAGDPGVVGSTIRLSAIPFTVVGILPPSFRGLHGDAEFWIPMMMQPVVMSRGLLSVRGSRWLSVIARLKPELSRAQAQDDMERVVEWLALTEPKQAGWGTLVVPLADQAVHPVVRRTILGLTIASGLVLLIACINLGHLLLARATTRHREIAIRMAVGAWPRRIARQLLTESLTLSLVGGLAGLLIANWGIRLLQAIRPVSIARLHASMDLPVLGFTLLLAAISGLAFGLLPALTACRLDFNQELRGS